MGLMDEISKRTADSESLDSLRVLSQLTDEQLSKVAAATGALTPAELEGIKEYRVRNGTGFALGRIMDVQNHELTDRDYRTFCFGMTLALRCMLRLADPIKGIIGDSVEWSTGFGTANPTTQTAWDKVPWVLHPEYTHGTNRGYGESLQHLLPGLIMLELGIPYSGAMAIVKEAIKASAVPGKWGAATRKWIWVTSPSVVAFWCEVADRCQDEKIFMEAAKMTKLSKAWSESGLIGPNSFAGAWATPTKVREVDMSVNVDEENAFAPFLPTTPEAETLRDAFETGDLAPEDEAYDTAMSLMENAAADQGCPIGDPEEMGFLGGLWSIAKRALGGLAKKGIKSLAKRYGPKGPAPAAPSDYRQAPREPSVSEEKVRQLEAQTRALTDRLGDVEGAVVNIAESSGLS